VVNWVSAFTVGQLFPYMVEWFGQAIAFFIFAIFGMMGAIAIAKCVKETRGLSEKAIDEMFSPVVKAKIEMTPKPEPSQAEETPTKLRPGESTV